MPPVPDDLDPSPVSLSANSFHRSIQPGETIAEIVVHDPRSRIVNFSPNDGRVVLCADGVTLRRGHAPLLPGVIRLAVDTWQAGASPPLRRSILTLAAADGTPSLNGRVVLPEARPGSPVGELLPMGAGSNPVLRAADGLVVLEGGGRLVKGRETVRPGYFNAVIEDAGVRGGSEITVTFKAPRTSVLVEDFEDLTEGWSNWTPAPAVHEADTRWFASRCQSLRLAQVPGVTTTVQATRTLPNEAALRENDVVSVAANVADPLATKSFALVLVDKNNRATQIVFDNLARGPSVYARRVAAGSAGAGFEGPVTAIRLAVHSAAAGGGAVSFDSIRFNAAGRATVVPMADDGYASQMRANDLLAAKNKGWRLTLALQVSAVGARNADVPRITLDQLQALKASGGVIVNHSTTHPDWATITQEDAEAELQGCIDFIRSNGLSTTVTTNGRQCKGSEHHCAYPGGGSSPATDAAMRAKGMLTGFGVRSATIATKDGVLGYHALARYGMARRSFAEIKAAIDAAVHEGGTLVVFCHDLDGSGIGTTIETYARMVDYLDALDEAGLIEVRTLLDWYEALPQAPLPLHGVNLAGGEFGGSGLALGTDYMYPTLAELRYYADRGANLFRIPFKYHRIMNPDGTSRAADIEALRAFVSAARKRGCTVVLDMHEYGCKDPDGRELYADTAADRALFRDRWRMVAERFSDLDNVRYCLMNEPRSVDSRPVPGPAIDHWIRMANAGIGGIRDADPNCVVHYMGQSWGTGDGWVSTGNADAFVAGIADPGDRLTVEVHQYLDDGSGKEGRPFVPGKALRCLAEATAHARSHGYKLFLGEFAATQEPSYIDEARKLLRFCHDNRDVWEGFAYWGGGPFWAAFGEDGTIRKPYSPEPRDIEDPDVPHLPQMNLLSEFMPIGN